MTTFFKEAARLWDLQSEEKSMTRIQAGLCLCKSHHSNSLGVCEQKDGLACIWSSKAMLYLNTCPLAMRPYKVTSRPY